MKTNIPILSRRGFSMVELLIVIGTIVAVAGMLWFHFERKRMNARSARISCVNHLKQIGIGFRLYATDGEPYPQYDATNEVWQYFQVIGKEIGSPKILMCPQDTRMNPAKAALDFEIPTTLTANNFAHPTHQNKDLSYFYSPDAPEERPDTILAGDKNISTNKTSISGILSVQTNTPIQWAEGPHDGYGNILLADGSAQMLSTAKLREQFVVVHHNNSNLTQRLLVP